jgi:hypothetical protein
MTEKPGVENISSFLKTVLLGHLIKVSAAHGDVKILPQLTSANISGS